MILIRLRFLSQVVKDQVNVYSHFVSMMGFQLPNSSDILLYNEEGCKYWVPCDGCMKCVIALLITATHLDQRAGRNLGRALFEYYKMLGQIPSDYIQSLQPVAGRKKSELTCAFRGMRSRTKMEKQRDEELAFHGASPLILEIDPCLQSSSYRPILRKPITIQMKDSIESRATTPISSGARSSTAMNSDAKETSIPSLSVIDFSSLTMSRKELRQIHKRKPNSLV